jgi:hypothetical protein
MTLTEYDRGRDPQPTTRGGALSGSISHGFLIIFQEPVSVSREATACVGEREVASGALNESNAETPLEIA